MPGKLCHGTKEMCEKALSFSFILAAKQIVLNRTYSGATYSWAM